MISILELLEQHHRNYKPTKKKLTLEDRILEILTDEPKTTREIADELGVNYGGIREPLKKLREAGRCNSGLLSDNNTRIYWIG